MKTKHLSSSKPADVDRAASLLRRGRLVAFATETVYGLGADALNPKAVMGIFYAKKRPVFDPLIVHISSMAQLKGLTSEFSPLARRLAKRFWPGPLTMVVPKSVRIPDVVTAGLSTVAVRMPSHPCAKKLLKRFGGPIAAPSANRFGYTSPTTANDVGEDLGGRIDAILEGGRSLIGLESTIVWPRGRQMTLLRQGAISISELRKIGPVQIAAHRPGEVFSPGGLATHYAPRTPMALLPLFWKTTLRALSQAKAEKKALRIGLILPKPPAQRLPGLTAVWVLSPSGNLDEAASNLFRAIRNLDKMELDVILAAPISQKGIGAAIVDRLKKAASGRYADKQLINEILNRK